MSKQKEPAAVGKRTGSGSRQGDYITLPRQLLIDHLLEINREVAKVWAVVTEYERTDI